MSLYQIIGVAVVAVVLGVGLLSPAYFDWKIGKLLDEYEEVTREHPEP